MTDPRCTRLAELLIQHSTALQPGEHVLIEASDTPEAILVELVRAARAAGGHPHVALRSQRVMRTLNEDAGEAQLTTWAEYDVERMKRMDCYIGVRGAHNVSEMAGVSDEQLQAIAHHYMKPVHLDQRVNQTRWCVLRWPTPSMAQLAQQSTEDFEAFYFEVCTADYGKMDQACKPLAAAMEAADRVRIKGPGETDLSFSIKDIPVIPCTGNYNIPDGECFTAPVRDSVNGVIQYNTPTIYSGRSFENIWLEFKDGRIIHATADQNAEQLDGLLDTDEGARYVGEFAIGFHPKITQPMKDILFDEKIAGSIHFTPGRAYEKADNGNRSELHWDLVLIQRADYTGGCGGGGELWFDDTLIRKDGLFVPEELKGLNPDHLG